MKKTLNIISLLIFSIFSMINYVYIFLFISVFGIRLLGSEIINTQNIYIYALIISLIAPIILSILTGILFYVLHKKKLKKTKNSFALFQLLLFAYSIYKLVEIISDNSPVAIYK